MSMLDKTNCPNRPSVFPVVIVLLFVGVACSSDTDPHSLEMLSLSGIELQDTEERVWTEVELRELFRLPDESEDGELFLAPGAVRADREGNIYVVDFRASAIYGFNSTGQYMATYGGVSGSGPGELRRILDMGVIGDSAVYVVDNQARRVLYFRHDGSFLRSENLDFAPTRYRFTSDGRSYAMVEGMSHMFESKKGPDVVEFGVTPKGPHGQHSAGGLLGMLTTFEKNLIYVPRKLPVLVQYKPDGTVEYARGTPDWGKVQLPEWETVEVGGSQLYRTVGEHVHGEVSVEEDKIYIMIPVSESDRAVDVYDAKTGDYEHSFRIGQINDPYLLNQRIYGLASDTTVVVYTLE